MELTEREKELIKISLHKSILRKKARISNLKSDGYVTKVEERELRELRNLIDRF